MGIFERIANAIFHIATGDTKKRWLYTPLVALLFLCFISLFFIAAYFTDRWLSLPSISYPPWTLIAGLVLLAPGFTIVAWTWVQFWRAHGTPAPVNPPHELITSGLYAYCRNPMLSGIFLMIFGAGLLMGSLSLIAFYAPLFVLALYLEASRIEEREMELKFGRAYLEYKQRVPMFFPRLPQDK